MDSPPDSPPDGTIYTREETKEEENLPPKTIVRPSMAMRESPLPPEEESSDDDEEEFTPNYSSTRPFTQTPTTTQASRQIMVPQSEMWEHISDLKNQVEELKQNGGITKKEASRIDNNFGKRERAQTLTNIHNVIKQVIFPFKKFFTCFDMNHCPDKKDSLPVTVMNNFQLPKDNAIRNEWWDNHKKDVRDKIRVRRDDATSQCMKKYRGE